MALRHARLISMGDYIIIALAFTCSLIAHQIRGNETQIRA